MTQAILFEKMEKFRSSNIAGAEHLIIDLEASARECFWSTCNYPIEYIRLRGSYPQATIKKVFALLGVKVTRVNRKAGKCEWKTIVHFKDAFDSVQ